LSLLTPSLWGAAIDVYWGLGVSQHGPATQGKLVPRILVADDNTNIQKMVVLAFQERGIEVIAVGNGEAAVRRIPDANPDLILADVFMPVRNGYEVCEFVKKDTRFSHIPVILLVGAFDPLDEKEARRVGADGVLKKPFVPPDPLIAMVMSALEKNPKVIAELAKAKEAKEAAATIAALPAAAMENPAMAEVKPLPEFPEPSPEEAAMIYGFGKGVRAIDSDETEEEETDAKSKSSQTLKDPQASQKKSKTPAVAAPKTPVVAMEEEDEETFDDSATASDWRRNAADFEVPDNVEANPIYSYGKNFEPITFPSERDVPPKHVRPEEVAEAEVAAEAAPEAAPLEASLPAAQSAAPDPAASWELTAEDEVASQQAESSSVDMESPLTSAATEEVPSVPIADNHANEILAVENEGPVAAAVDTVEAQKSEPVQESREAARPSFVARVRGWMDMMSPSSDEPAETPAESRDQHWMTSLASPAAASSETFEAQNTETVAPLQASEVENPVKVAEAEALAETAAPPAMVETAVTAASESSAPEVRSEAAYEAPSEPAPMANLDEPQGEASPFSAHEFEPSRYEADSVSSSSEAEAISQNDGQLQEPAHDEFHAADEDALPVVAVEAPAEDLHASTQERWTDLLQTSGEAQHNNGDAPSEHLPLEPIISDLHEQPLAALAEPEQEPAHVAEWLRHRANESGHNQPDVRAEEPLSVESAEPEPAGQAWAQDHSDPVYEKPFADQPEPSIFDQEPAEAFAQQFAERIPTLPPPNREALSQIPFLMPRPEREPVTSDSMNASNSAAVDEVVRRVLEKLQPQLHELLSRGVKPLVENMLQDELKSEFHKNEK
jgi:CheY-like chemotaxis protein